MIFIIEKQKEGREMGVGGGRRSKMRDREGEKERQNRGREEGR